MASISTNAGSVFEKRGCETNNGGETINIQCGTVILVEPAIRVLMTSINEKQKTVIPAQAGIQKIDNYLKVQYVMEKLNCTERHIYNLIIEGELEAIKIGKGNAKRISESSLVAFIARRKINPEDLYDPDKEKKPAPAVPATQQIARSKFIGR
jgi:excisionase family DNA binding protein